MNRKEQDMSALIDQAQMEDLKREEEALNAVNPYEGRADVDGKESAFIILTADISSSPHPDRIVLESAPPSMYDADAPDLPLISDLASRVMAGQSIMLNFFTNERPKPLPNITETLSVLQRASVLRHVPIRVLRSATAEILFPNAPESWAWWSADTLAARTAGARPKDSHPLETLDHED